MILGVIRLADLRQKALVDRDAHSMFDIFMSCYVMSCHAVTSSRNVMVCFMLHDIDAMYVM